MISVVIPVINQLDITKQLLYSMINNTIQPKEIILIDNGSKDPYETFINYFPQETNCLTKINYLKNETNIGVNPSWNLGISKSKEKYISILNNDIYITNYFFKKIVEVFEDNKNIGIVVPNTVDYIPCFESDDTFPKVRDLEKREGWAFTIKKELTNKIPPIPPEINKCFGDDYLFYWVKKLGYKCVKVMNNPIFHIGSLTQIEEFKKNNIPDKESERKNWVSIKRTIDKIILGDST